MDERVLSDAQRNGGILNLCPERHGGAKYENYILPLLAVVVNAFLMGMCFDFYYDLNDDTMMLDIMSGAYSGTPDGHNMQTLYPLGAVIAFCYRLCGRVPWYGLFLLLCQFGCLCLVGVRLCVLADGTGKPVADRKARRLSVVKKISYQLLLALGVWGVCLEHFVNIQYTVTAAILSAAAIFLFLTASETDDSREFLIQNIPSMALVILSYQLRSEMLLLTLPYIGLAGLYRLAGEKRIFVKDNLVKYGGVLGIMLAGMLVSRGIDYVAYGSEEWKDFLRFFEARTTVYDFYPELITEEEYAEELTRLGVGAHQQTLLRNYNYGLDETIDTELLAGLADYAANTLRAARDWNAIVREQTYRYFYRIFRGGDGPYSILLLGMCAVVLAAGIFGGGVWQVVLLAAARSAIWMFILLRGRDPARITHSLYLVEFAVLLGIFQQRFLKLRQETMRFVQSAARGIALVFAVLAAVWVTDSVSSLRLDQERREAVNEGGSAIEEYCRMHPENFYFEDVYSTVSFSRKIFGGSLGSGYANYDIMGGWMCGSPLYYEKIGQYGIESVQKALLERDNVYLIMSDAEALDQGFAWIEDYYGVQGISVSVRKKDMLGNGYSVYQVLGEK